MKATARQTSSYTHQIDMRQHRVTADEPSDQGGDDQGATPQELLAASLASCTAITMEMYARRKRWDVGPVEVEVSYEQPEKGQPTEFTIVLRLPEGLTDEQARRLQMIAARCPVHRVLASDVSFVDRVERA
jgi:putative redox protein